jgi:hypothetical protein
MVMELHSEDVQMLSALVQVSSRVLHFLPILHAPKLLVADLRKAVREVQITVKIHTIAQEVERLWVAGQAAETWLRLDAEGSAPL